MAILKERLKELRNEKGLNQEDLGKLFGLVKSTISMYENGHSTPDDELKKKLSEFFGVSMDYFMGLSDIKESAEKIVSQKLGNNIRKLRELNDISQKELAEKLNISNTTLSQYESGKRTPSDDVKIKIADFFNVSIDYLLGKTDIKESAEDIINKKYYDTETNDLNKKDLKSKFSDRLCELRKEKGLSQGGLGILFKISQQTISSYENGTREPDSEFLKSLAKYFDVSTDYILGISDIKESAYKIINHKSGIIQEFGERLKSLRSERKLTQSDLSKLLKVSPSTIGMYEQNRRDPDSATIKFLAEYFNVSIDYLLGKTDIRESAEELTQKLGRTNRGSSSDPELNKKDFKSIEKDLEEIMQDISSPDSGFAAFDGNTDIDPEDIEMFENAMRIALTQIKKINKIKYNPNKINNRR